MATDGWTTRDRILREASRYFAARGYAGTSTRDVALAVGIRQPSLYSHFRSKQEIAETLLDHDLQAGLAFMGPLMAEEGSPAVRLYRYIAWEVGHCLESPFDLRALYNTDLLDQPEFAPWRAMLNGYDDCIRDLVRQAVAVGEFASIDPEFARRSIDALIMETIRRSGRDEADRDPVEAAAEPGLTANFLLRALLARPSTVGSIRGQALRANQPTD